MSARFFRRISDAAGVLAGAAKVEVLRPGVNTSGQTAHVEIFADAALTLPLANPYVSSTATAEFYTADPQRVRLVVALVNGTVYDDIVDTWPSEPLVRAPATLRVPPAVAGKYLVGTAPGIAGWSDWPVGSSSPDGPLPDVQASWTRRVPADTYDDATLSFYGTDLGQDYYSLLWYQDTSNGEFYMRLNKYGSSWLTVNLFSYDQTDTNPPELSLPDGSGGWVDSVPAGAPFPLCTGADAMSFEVYGRRLVFKRNEVVLLDLPDVLPEVFPGTYYTMQFYDGSADVTSQVQTTVTGPKATETPIPPTPPPG